MTYNLQLYFLRQKSICKSLEEMLWKCIYAYWDSAGLLPDKVRPFSDTGIQSVLVLKLLAKRRVCGVGNSGTGSTSEVAMDTTYFPSLTPMSRS